MNGQECQGGGKNRAVDAGVAAGQKEGAGISEYHSTFAQPALPGTQHLWDTTDLRHCRISREQPRQETAD